MRVRSPLLTSLSAGLFVAAFWLLFRTLRLRVREDTPGTNPYAKSPPEWFLYCVWHDSMVIPAFAGKQRSSAALTSQHADGTFVAAVLRKIGMATVRGSTNHIGPGAVRQLLRTTEDKHLVITPDGPRGPRRQMSVGIAFLASRTGRAVVPTAASCVRCWKIRGSWTDLVIPKPFTKVFLLGGEPIRVPPDLGSDELREYAKRIQTAMDQLDEAAQQLVKDAKAGHASRCDDKKSGTDLMKERE
ncbi:MAG: lysophospholipid acyltransferase family protein [Pirellulales bacterium]|nr:lysophospholipid acyltransferase family protein [Pirellulales bacterium]